MPPRFSGSEHNTLYQRLLECFELLLDGNREQRPGETEFVAVGVNQMEGALMPFGIVGRGSWLVSRCERSAVASMRVRC